MPSFKQVIGVVSVILITIVIERVVGLSWWRIGVAIAFLTLSFIMFRLLRVESVSVAMKISIGVALVAIYFASVWLTWKFELPCRQINPNDIVVSSLLSTGEAQPVLPESGEVFVSPAINSITLSVDLKQPSNAISCKWVSPFGTEVQGSECAKKFNIIQAEDQSVINVDIFAQDCKKPFHESVILRRVFQEG